LIEYNTSNSKKKSSNYDEIKHSNKINNIKESQQKVKLSSKLINDEVDE
jgi:hypothetical protein